jgi:hypothetical protein
MKSWGLVLVLLLVFVAGCGGPSDGQDAAAGKKADSDKADLSTVTIEASGRKKVEVLVEIADGPLERERGLMYRTALGEDRGMLFVFPEAQPLSFWMKNTKIPLSIAYIDSKGRITDLLDMKPLDDEPPHYTSSEPVRYALEVNQSFFQERGVKVGDHAELPE